MLQLSDRKLYLASKEQQIVGVFSSPETAQNTPHDELTELSPFLLDGSPASERYVCMAAGTYTILLREGDSFSTRIFDVDPLWALNPQSAVAALCGQDFSRGSASLSELLLFEIDRSCETYAPQPLHKHNLFICLAHSICQSKSITDEQVKTDYIERHFEMQRQAAACAEKASAPELKLICDKLMEIARKRASANGRKVRCGFALSRERERLEDALLHQFTLTELKQLAALMRLTESPETPPLPREEAESLLARAVECIPRVAGSRRRLADNID